MCAARTDGISTASSTSNPDLKQRGLAMVYNPLDQPVTRQLLLPLYYTGLKDRARIRREEGAPQSYTLDRNCAVNSR